MVAGNYAHANAEIIRSEIWKGKFVTVHLDWILGITHTFGSMHLRFLMTELWIYAPKVDRHKQAVNASADRLRIRPHRHKCRALLSSQFNSQYEKDDTVKVRMSLP